MTEKRMLILASGDNVGVLLDAAKKISNLRVKFLIWGAGDELEALQKRVADEHIENVVFKGRVEKKYVPYIVSRADVNIAHNTASPLFRFGISFNKLFEYLAAGKASDEENLESVLISSIRRLKS